MQLKKKHKKELNTKLKDQVGDTIHHGKTKNTKEKYKHKSHWLEQDDDLELPTYKDEEE